MQLNSQRGTRRNGKETPSRIQLETINLSNTGQDELVDEVYRYSGSSESVKASAVRIGEEGEVAEVREVRVLNEEDRGFWRDTGEHGG